MQIKRQLTYPEFFLLNKMIIKKFIGGKRTTLKDAMKGVAPIEKGAVKEAYKTFKKNGYIVKHGRKKGDDYISLDPSKISEIVKLLEENVCRSCGRYTLDVERCQLCREEV